MTTFQTSIVAGVFRDSDSAQKAVEALRNADFKYDQVGVAMRSAPNATQNLHDDLMKLGVPHELASFYEQEYQANRIVVSVRPDGRDAEARDILQRHGAYDHTSNPEARPAASSATEERATNYGPTQTWNEAEQGKREPQQQQGNENYSQGWNPAMGNPPSEDPRPHP
jgi:hypothetical protein